MQYPLVNLTSTPLCDGRGISPDVVKGKALVVMRGDCDFSQKALVAQNLGATTLLIASNKTLVGHQSLFLLIYIKECDLTFSLRFF